MPICNHPSSFTMMGLKDADFYHLIYIGAIFAARKQSHQQANIQTAKHDTHRRLWKEKDRGEFPMTRLSCCFAKLLRWGDNYNLQTGTPFSPIQSLIEISRPIRLKLALVGSGMVHQLSSSLKPTRFIDVMAQIHTSQGMENGWINIHMELAPKFNDPQPWVTELRATGV